jgi:Domain of unknown function DUF302
MLAEFPECPGCQTFGDPGLAIGRVAVGSDRLARVAGVGRPAQDYVVTTAAGIVDRPSKQSVDETVERIEGILRSKGITLFALIDHGAEAAKVGLKMPPTKLLIFGKPQGGTP